MRPPKSEIRRLVETRHTTRQIAEHYGVTMQTAQRYRRYAGCPGAPSLRKQPIDGELIISLTRDGYSLQQIAKKMGISPRTVVRYRTAAKIPNPRPGRPYTPEEQAFAERLLEDGASYYEVAKTIGRTHNSVSDKFKGKSRWTAKDGGELRGWQKSMIKVHGEPFERLLREITPPRIQAA